MNRVGPDRAPIPDRNTVDRSQNLDLLSSGIQPGEDTSRTFGRDALLNREIVLDGLSRYHTHSIDGLVFALREEGPLYRVSDQFFGRKAAVASIEAMDTYVDHSQHHLVIKRLEGFHPEDTRILPLGMPSPEDRSSQGELLKRAISIVRDDQSPIDWAVNKVLDYWRSDFSPNEAVVLADTLRGLGGINDPIEVHRARRPLREIAAHCMLTQRKAIFEAYPDVYAPCAPELHDIYLREERGGTLVPYLVMERVTGVPLKEYLDKEKDSSTFTMQLLDISRQILQQGMTLMNYGVAHCDSAIRNVVATSIDYQGTLRPLVRLIDFGFVYLPHLAEAQGINGFADCELIAPDAEYDRPQNPHEPLYNIFGEIDRIVSDNTEVDPNVRGLINKLASQYESWFPLSFERAIREVVALQDSEYRKS